MHHRSGPLFVAILALVGMNPLCLALDDPAVREDCLRFNP